ncbi:MAG: hypothetical protein GX915_07145 [Clostridiales bacterium]|nr:hypothetical protein [Clostridiales bacterium]
MVYNMSSFGLKMIAIITMLIDHIGAVFIPSNTTEYLIFRSIGRLAFPIFVFLLVEGFYHTRDSKKYLIRLGIFALISEIPFDLAFYGDFYMGHQNIFFTLFLGLLLIILMRDVEVRFPKNVLAIYIIKAILVIVFCIISIYLQTDYSFLGILLITAFYLFRGNKILLVLSMLIIFGTPIGGINVLATLSMIFIALYNGKKGKSMKYFFYIFYPAHLTILFLISQYIKM